MNVFLFEERTRRLIISPNFWIFIAVWIPLTVMTGGVYAFIKSKSKSKRKALVGERGRSPGKVA
jgi:hypothetical protein